MIPDIRRPSDREAAACRALVPEAFPSSGSPADLLVASGPGGVVGAAATAWIPRGFPVLFRVTDEPVMRNAVTLDGYGSYEPDPLTARSSVGLEVGWR